METQADSSIVFEQPLTERVRTFLRLEFLFAQHDHHRADASLHGVRCTLHLLLDILTVLSRSDLKNEILKELGDQQVTLTRLSKRPGVDQTRLQGVLDEIARAMNGLQQMSLQTVGNILRENDFLTAVLNRYSIPGGTCGFDLPAYHHWLSQPLESARRDLDVWFAGVRPFQQAIALYLRLLRQSVESSAQTAAGGMYVHMPQGPCLLLRVLVAQGAGVYPEISAGRHRFTVRFMSARDVNQRSHQVTQDVPFQMQCCNL